jgi:hypothetical protein
VASHGHQSRRVAGIALEVGDAAQMGGQRLDGNRVEVETLTAGPDGVEELVGLGGGEHKMDVVGGLLEGLEEGVARRLGEHVGLVEDEHPFGPGVGGHGGDRHPDVADVLDRVVAGGVEFHHVERRPLDDRGAALALVAGRAVGVAVLAIEGLGEDAGGGGLAGAARAGEQVGVGDALLGHLAGEGGGDVSLADHVVEALGPILAIQGLVFHADPTVPGGSDKRRTQTFSGSDPGSAHVSPAHGRYWDP